MTQPESQKLRPDWAALMKGCRTQEDETWLALLQEAMEQRSYDGVLTHLDEERPIPAFLLPTLANVIRSWGRKSGGAKKKLTAVDVANIQLSYALGRGSLGRKYPAFAEARSVKGLADTFDVSQSLIRQQLRRKR